MKEKSKEEEINNNQEKINNDLCIICLGRTGAMPQITKLLTEEIVKLNKDFKNPNLIKNFNLIISKDNVLKTETLNIKNDSFIIKTPNTNKDVLLNFFHFIFSFTKIILKNKNKNYFFIVTHIYNIFAMILIKIFIRKSNIMYICHDGNVHPGEKNNFLQSIISKIEIKLANQVITLSESVTNILRDKYKYTNIKNIFLPVFTNKKENKEKERILSEIPTFLFFGRMVKYKGLSLFIDSLEIFLEKYKKQIKVIIAGDGEIEEDVKDKIHKINKNYNNIELINRYINENEIEKIWNKSDICVLPYIEASQSGVVAIAINEAMPCIITPTDGLLKQCDLKENPFVLISKNIQSEDFAEKMNEILNKDIYEKLSRNTLILKKELSWEKFVIEIYKILK